MYLPTQAQVNAASRHVASFAGGAILMFGLSSKISPETVTQIIAASGTVINDVIVFIGLVSPLVAGYYASHSASPTSQVQSVQTIANTGGPEQVAAQVAIVNAAASLPSTAKIVNPSLAPNPATSAKVTVQ